MPVIIKCVKCQRKLRVQERLLGKAVKCPGCQTKFVAQAAGAPTAAMASAPPLTRSPAQGAPPSKAPTVPPPSSRGSSRPPSRTPAGPPPSSRVPPRPPSSRAQAPRPHAIAPGPPPEEITIAHPVEEAITRPHAAASPEREAPDEEFETAPRLARKRAAPPRPSSFFGVFVVLGGLMLLTAIFGLVMGWWVNSSVQSLRGRVIPMQQQPQKPMPPRK